MARKYYRKPHRYKIKKPFFRKKMMALVFLALVFAGAIFYAAFLWKALWVNKIIVSGEQKIAKENIESIAVGHVAKKVLFFDTRSILAVDTEAIIKDVLAAFPGIAQVKVKRSFFDAISIEIQERAGVALWCNTACFLLDKEGVIFEEVTNGPDLLTIESQEPGTSPSLGQTIISSAELSQILSIKSKLAEAAKISIKKAVPIPDDNRLNIETQEGWEIYLNLKGDIDWQIQELVQVLEKQISVAKRNTLQYIDLRFSRVYYK